MIKLLLHRTVETPIGPMIAMASSEGLSLLEFTDRPALASEMEELERRHDYTIEPGRNAVLNQIEAELTAYFAGKPDPAVPAQRVAFGTSGHRGSALNNAFNEAHILAVSQALCDYRRGKGIDGPLFVGIDTHALAEPA